MPTIPLAHLHPHPDNANEMAMPLFNKLKKHIKTTGHYPPIIVRPHPTIENEYQLLDGHHRTKALAALEFKGARCEVWEVDDAEVDVLLLTLNRLHGKDDPHKRAALLARLRHELGEKHLLAKIPDRAASVARLLEIHNSLPPVPKQPHDAKWPLPLTFFLDAESHARVLSRLHKIDQDRNVALARLAAE